MPDDTFYVKNSALPLAVASGGTGGAARSWAGLLTPTAVKTGAYTAAAGDFVPCDTTSGSFTVTLPSAPADLTVAGVKHVIQGGANTVTIACGGSDVFNKASGATSGTLTLLAQGMLLQYRASGAIWYVVADDLALPQLDLRYVAQSSLPLPIASGGTGQAAQQAAIDALTGTQSAGKVLRSDGTHATLASLQAADVPTLNQSTTGTAAGLSATLAIASGGTGQTSAAAAYNALSPMTTLGDLEYESGAATASRLAGNTTTVTKALMQAGNGTVSAAPAWTALGTSGSGAAVCDYTQPSGATAATIPRWAVATSQPAMTSGTLYVTAMNIPAGTVVNNLTFMTGTTVKTGGTHGWYVLLDSSLVVRAVTADQTDAATVWGAQKALYTLATNAYTATYTGLYYAGVMVAQTSGTMPTFAGAAILISAAAVTPAPVFSGSSSTAQTTPPSTGATMTSVSGLDYIFYAYTS